MPDRFSILDNYGNPINLPINQQPPYGIWRTYVNSNDPASGYSLGSPANVMVKLNSLDNTNYPLGFTPQEAYYYDPTNINPNTGFPFEYGNRSTQVSLNNNTGLNKISRTSINWGQNSNSFFVKNINTGTSSTKYKGFTPKSSYVTDATINPNTNTYIQYGTFPNDIVPNFNKNSPIYTTPDLVVNGATGIPGMKNVYKSFKDDSQYSFVHNLDRKTSITSGLSNPSSFRNVYLSTFQSTNSNNEDPVMFGYDIVIKYDSSPLFNGAIPSFINEFGNSESKSRIDIWLAFCNHFFNFFKVDYSSVLSSYNNNNYSSGLTQSTANGFNGTYKNLPPVSVSSSTKSKINNTRTYYIKKISGLNNLVTNENLSISEKIKTMIEYGKDVIKLSLYEDVSVNTGHLAMLYKTLSWSRINGRQIIPENLLRFDVDISVRELRDYNRYVKNGSIYDVYPDQLTTYTYTLYDCQFMFDEMSHGDDIDMSKPELKDDFNISFNYKYSTLSFDFYDIISGTQGASYTKNSIDNSSESFLLKPSDSNASYNQNNTIQNNKSPINMKSYDHYPKNSDTIPQPSGGNTVDDLVQNYNYKQNLVMSEEPNFGQSTDINSIYNDNQVIANITNSIKQIAVGAINREISIGTRLLNTTLNNIRYSLGLPIANGIQPPTNVYQSYGETLIQEVESEITRGFFTPPNLNR